MATLSGELKLFTYCKIKSLEYIYDDEISAAINKYNNIFFSLL